MLQKPPQRPGAVNRVEPLAGDQRSRGAAEVELDVAVGQPPAQFVGEQVDDALDLVQRQGS